MLTFGFTQNTNNSFLGGSLESPTSLSQPSTCPSRKPVYSFVSVFSNPVIRYRNRRTQLYPIKQQHSVSLGHTGCFHMHGTCSWSAAVNLCFYFYLGKIQKAFYLLYFISKTSVVLFFIPLSDSISEPGQRWS